MDIRNNFFSESIDALAQAAQGGGGVPIPGGVKELWHMGTWSVGMVGDGLGSGLGNLGSSPTLMIL